MAGKQAVGWPGTPPHHYYDLRAEPMGWWQRHIRWLPFLKDTRPQFRLTVSCVQSNVPSQTLRWFISFEQGARTGDEILVPPMTQGQQQTYIIGGRLLGFGGDTILGVDLPSGEFHTLVSFWTLRGETILYGAILAVLSGIVGALFALLIN
jgi:hypothetical protein